MTGSSVSDALLANYTAELARLQAQVSDMYGAVETNSGAIDTSWVLLSATVIFFMQCGFGMLEAGAVRAKNTRNILMKNLLDTCIGAVIFWATGWGFAYGPGNSFIGAPAPYEVQAVDPSLVWFHQYSYAAASTTIVSGAIAERTKTTAYIYHSLSMTGLVYPVVVHWIWSSAGWLSTSNPSAVLGGCIDFAGSGVVHLTGGVVALVAAKVIGPRKGRFNESTGEPQPMPGHSSVLMALGCFSLWFGWIAFNIGSVTSIVSDPDAPSRVAATTMLAGAAGGITVLLINLRFGTKAWSVECMINGILAGLVSITAGAAVVTSWASLVIGVAGGFFYYGCSQLVVRLLRVDDVLDAFAVHGGCGLWGIIAPALFASPDYRGSFGAGTVGLFYGEGKLLGAAVLAGLSITAWSGLIGAVLWGTLRRLDWLRVSAEAELIGVDHGQHGGSAYGVDVAESPEPEYPPPYVEPMPRVPSPPRSPPTIRAAPASRGDNNRSIEIQIGPPPHQEHPTGDTTQATESSGAPAA